MNDPRKIANTPPNHKIVLWEVDERQWLDKSKDKILAEGRWWVGCMEGFEVVRIDHLFRCHRPGIEGSPLTHPATT
jgi:hypothetical protein